MIRKYKNNLYKKKLTPLNSTQIHLSSSPKSPLAVMRLSELLTKSKKVAEVPPKKGTKNQKPFLKMYIMQLDNIKMTVGLQKSTGDKVQYCITAL